MAEKKRGLGKSLSDMGLNELLSDQPPAAATPVSAAIKSGVEQLDIEALTPGRYQPRQHFNQEALQELSQSIKKQGIIQPIVVRPRAGGKFEIVAGERRWRASKLAGLTQVPVIKKELNDEATIAIALIENIQRQDLNAIEESIALQRLISEFDMTHQQVAEAVGKSRTTVTNLLRLLNLNVTVRRMLEQSQIEMGHARALLSLGDEQQIRVAEYVIKKKLSVRETERFIKRLQFEPGEGGKHRAPVKNPDVARLERELSDKLHADVKFEYNNKGKGKLVIKYNSFDELDGILAKFKD